MFRKEQIFVSQDINFVPVQRVLNRYKILNDRLCVSINEQ